MKLTSKDDALITDIRIQQSLHLFLTQSILQDHAQRRRFHLHHREFKAINVSRRPVAQQTPKS